MEEISDLRDCENELVQLLVFDKFDLIKILVKNRFEIVQAIQLTNCTSDQERLHIREEIGTTEECKILFKKFVTTSQSLPPLPERE